MLKKLQFKPGIVRDSTAYANEGGWYDCNLVRFRNGSPETVGGLTQKTYSTTGTCRSLHGWYALDGTDFLGIGTHLKLQLESGGTLYDITPVRSTVALPNNPFLTVTAGTGIIQVTTTLPHAAILGDYVTISGATGPFDGITAAAVNKEHQIISIVGANAFQIVVTDAAVAGGVVGGGAAASAAFQINIGLDDGSVSTGWGTGIWGRGGWGSAGAYADIRIWSQDNYGEDLIACPNDGRIYWWDKSGGTGTRAVGLDVGGSDVPLLCRQILVSTDRHLIALACNEIGSVVMDRMLVRWSNQEDTQDWTPLSTNTAGSYRLQAGSEIVHGIRARQEILIWTDVALHSMQFIGPPYTFGFTLLADGTGLIGPQAAVVAGGAAYWMDRGRFWAYAGSAQPIHCPVSSYVFEDLNYNQAAKIIAGSSHSFGEVTWFYPSADSSENNRYVTYNYIENCWYYGQIDRTAWLEKHEAYPIAVASTGLVYNHDVTGSQGGTAGAFIESSDVDLDDGDKFTFVRKLIPDIWMDGSGPVTVKIKGRRSPGGTLDTLATAEVAPTTEANHIRLRQRQIVVRVENGELVNTVWRLGALRLDLREDGRK